MALLTLAENSVQLVPDGSLFIHIGVILLMVWILNATLFKPINRILENRERRTRGRSDQARDILRNVEKKLVRYERSLREARAEAYRLMEEERTRALSERQSRLMAIRDEIRALLEQEKQAIDSQREAARASLVLDAKDTALKIGERILHRPISNATSGTGSRV